MSFLPPTLVVNPHSRGGALGKQWPELAHTLRRELGPFEELHTTKIGDGMHLARQAIESGAHCVVAMGGDGTINEVLNGFFHGTQPISNTASLGILPFGSGGDFCKTVGIPKDLALAARRLATSKPRPIDVGAIQYTTYNGHSATRLFINIASFGVSALVDEYVNTSSKRLGGRLSFLLASLRAQFAYQNQRVRLFFDDDESSAVDTLINTVAVANGRYFGGGMYIAPDAELNDGVFDIIQLGDLNLYDLVRNTHRVYQGTHLHLDKVHHRRAKAVCASPLGQEPVRLDIDGEDSGCLPASFRVLPQAIRIVA